MTDTIDFEAITTKLTQIRALAERAGTLAEAEVAAAKLTDLLTRYNLTLADLDAHAEKAGRRVQSEDLDYQKSANKWHGSLLHVLARAHMCRAVSHPWKNSVTVVGHAHNLIVVRELYLWLVDEIDRLAKIERDRIKAMPLPEEPGPRPDYIPYGKPGYHDYKMAIRDYHERERPYRDAARLKHDAANRWSAFRHAFRLGAVNGIREALRKAQQQVKDSVTTEQWAIVPVLEKEVAQVYREMFPHTTPGSAPRMSSSGAYSAGRAAGAGINMHRQVGSSGRVAGSLA